MPALISADKAPPGEVDLFYRLRDDPATADWIVLHSLDIVNHQTQVSGEIDFVIIVPTKGILCLEVKSHARIRRSEGGWYYGSATKADVRGPFKQAADAMHSMRRELVKVRRNFTHIVFWSGVVFPYAPFRMQSTEWHDWQVIDSRKYRSAPIASNITNILDSARKFLAAVDCASWFDPSSGEPTLEQCEEIAQLLRPNFEFFENPAAHANRTAAEVLHFTKEQFLALDSMQRNPRVVFTGPAGTGKTVLAIEASRRSAESGNRVLFLCYNRLLCERLERDVAKIGSSVEVATLHSHMIRVAGKPEIEDSPAFWTDTLPSLAIDTMLDTTAQQYTYDELIIDEAQDILYHPYLDFLDLSLRGGLAAGRWRMFGDFERQAIYAGSDIDLSELVKTRVPSTPIFELRINCRNTPRVAEFVHLLGRLSPRYTRTLRPDNQIDPKLLFYSSRSVQQSQLLSTIEEFLDGGARPDDIVVLSPRAKGSCALELALRHESTGKLYPYSIGLKDKIRYSTIHAFKGLEAPFIVVTDIDTIDGDNAQALFYIAATRTLEQIVFVMDTRVQTEIRSLLLPNG